MKLKKIEGLSLYLFAEDGSVFDLDGNQVRLFKEFKLTTDEVMKVKGSKLKVVRRFQPEEINKLYYGPKAKDVESEESFKHLNSFPVQKEEPPVPIPFSKKELKGLNKMAAKKAVIEEASHFDQKQFDYIKEKIDASKKAVKTDDQKAAKAKKATVKKVEKAIQEAGSDLPPVASELPEGFKYPYIVINGIPYQSARKASEAGNGSVNTVLKKAKANKDGFAYIESKN